MFRTLGLRHVIVLNSRSEVVGIVARAELLEKNLHRCIGDKWAGSRQTDFDKPSFGQIEMTSYDDGDQDRLDSSMGSDNSGDRLLAGGADSAEKSQASDFTVKSNKRGKVIGSVKSDNKEFFGDDDDF